MKGSSPQLQSPPGSIPNIDTSCLIYACIHGLDAVVDVLVHRPKVNVNHADFIGWTPIIAAHASKNARCIDILMRAGAAPISENMTLPFPPPTILGRFIWELVYRHHYYHAELFARHGKDPDRARYRPKECDTALYHAVVDGAYSLCSVLLTSGAKVDLPSRNRMTVLEVALYAYTMASKEKPDMMEEYRQTILVLLSHGARLPRAHNRDLPDFCTSFARRELFYGSPSMAVLSMCAKPRNGRLETSPVLSRRACSDLGGKCACNRERE